MTFGSGGRQGPVHVDHRVFHIGPKARTARPRRSGAGHWAPASDGEGLGALAPSDTRSATATGNRRP